MIEIDIKKKLSSSDGEMMLSLNQSIEKGEFIGLYGPSGAGKTSTLEMIAGLMKPDEGYIKVNGKYWYQQKAARQFPMQERNIAYMFQDYALFPNMSIEENITFAAANKANKQFTKELMSTMGLTELANKKPATLSGGQKQRVALARALAQQPDILLLDEPLSALDTKVRLELQDYLSKYHKSLGLTTIMISHDISELVKLTDRVLQLDKGQVIKEGSPQDLFMNKTVSGKFKFTGEVIGLQQQGFLYIVTVLIQNNPIRVIAQQSEIDDIRIGDTVVVASKAFNPIIYKLNQ